MLTDRAWARNFRWLTLGIGIGLSLILIGCSRQPPPQLTPTSPPGALQTPDEETPEEAQAAAREAVADYLRALYAQQYKQAYDGLSAASKEHHSQEAFAAAAKEGQVVYDLDMIEVKQLEDGAAYVIVALQEEEEPGNKSFEVKKESGQWKIVYIEGSPFFPYGE